ncbi:MAG TPA: S53 family peptidase [Burkholderiaceae bacterium]|nr:S53 family peptidase [Burkholderiaceae bacterium]
MALALAAGISMGALAPAQAAGGGTVIAHNTPLHLEQAQDLGAEDSLKTIAITVWLKSPTPEATQDRAVEALYTRGSASFHRWQAGDTAVAGSAPTAEQVQAVRKFLADGNLAVTQVDEHNLFVRAVGTVRDVQAAFNVELHRFQRAGATFRANTSDPSIVGPAGALVAAVGGLAEHRMVPHLQRRVNPDTGKAVAALPLTVSANGAFYSAQCLRDPQKQVFTTSGGLPVATYHGNRYGQDITNTALGSLPPCGYQPSDVQAAYGLDALYAKGLDGSGQTIVIVDAIGSPTIAADAETFSQVYGLPDITSENFHVYYPGGPPAAPDTGWASETSLDVEWAHSIAPKAKIALVIAPTANDSDLQAAVLFAIHHHLGNVISNSYGEAEGDLPPANLDAWNRISRHGAAHGISVDFSSGDNGDSNPSGVTTNLVLFGVSSPADSPWATGVGGTSLFVRPDGSIKFQTAWGTNLTKIVSAQSAGADPLVPPSPLGFQFGGGGGVSTYFAKPRFQAGLPGAYRHVPDIAYIADPYTGVEIICDGASCFGDPPGAEVGVIGGTSLASPAFSGLWAIANQRAGEPLGQAARILYDLPRKAITDIVPFASPDNVEGFIKTATGSTWYSAWDLAQPLGNPSPFISAMYNSPFSTSWFVITFGTDSSLATSWGYDHATGLGTPTGADFVESVAEAAWH